MGIGHEALTGSRNCLRALDDRGEGFEESEEFEGSKEFDLLGEQG
jgi:hypothetical protein